MFICVKCKREMVCEVNGVGADYGNGHVYMGDKYRCPVCNDAIIATNHTPSHDPNGDLAREYIDMKRGE